MADEENDRTEQTGRADDRNGSRRIDAPSTHPRPERNGDGLDARQFRLLVVGSVVFAALFLLMIGGISALSEFGGGPTHDGPPEAAFVVDGEQLADGVAVNVTHEGGEAADPDEIVLEIDGQRRGTWSELGGDGPGIVAPGHTLVYTGVDGGEEIRILWVPEDDDGTVVELGRGIVRVDG